MDDGNWVTPFMESLDIWIQMGIIQKHIKTSLQQNTGEFIGGNYPNMVLIIPPNWDKHIHCNMSTLTYIDQKFIPSEGIILGLSMNYLRSV